MLLVITLAHKRYENMASLTEVRKSTAVTTRALCAGIRCGDITV